MTFIYLFLLLPLFLIVLVLEICVEVLNRLFDANFKNRFGIWFWRVIIKL